MEPKHFLTLTTKYTNNIGDEIQIIAANRFLTKQSIAGTIDRDRLSTYKGELAKAILNGWFLHGTKHWPPSKNIYPLITSLHITDTPSEETSDIAKEIMFSDDNIGFLNTFAPIGARDIGTYNDLHNKNIPAYFSGCLTLTLEKRGLKKKGTICCIDLDDATMEHVNSLANGRKIIHLQNSYDKQALASYDEAMLYAQERLDTYEQADIVISKRLHAILPSLAIGTPTLLLQNKSVDKSRYLGLKDLSRNCTQEEFIAGFYNDFVLNPDAPLDFHKVIRKNLTKIVTKFINNDPITDQEISEIHSENLLAAFLAQERNDQVLVGYTDQLINKNKPADKISLRRLFSR